MRRALPLVAVLLGLLALVPSASAAGRAWVPGGALAPSALKGSAFSPAALRAATQRRARRAPARRGGSLTGGARPGLSGAALPAPATTGTAAAAALESAVLQGVNAVRAANGLARLSDTAELQRAAGVKVDEIAASATLDHASPDGTSMATRVRRFLAADAVGETLGFLPAGTADDAGAIVGMWMSSPMHRATLLSPTFARAGVAALRAPQGTVVALNLASPR